MIQFRNGAGLPSDFVKWYSSYVCCVPLFFTSFCSHFLYQGLDIVTKCSICYRQGSENCALTIGLFLPCGYQPLFESPSYLITLGILRIVVRVNGLAIRPQGQHNIISASWMLTNRYLFYQFRNSWCDPFKSWQKVKVTPTKRTWF